jgi:hypothetical protein
MNDNHSDMDGVKIFPIELCEYYHTPVCTISKDGTKLMVPKMPSVVDKRHKHGKNHILVDVLDNDK